MREGEMGSGMRTHSESKRTRQTEGETRSGSVSVLRSTMCMVASALSAAVCAGFVVIVAVVVVAMNNVVDGEKEVRASPEAERGQLTGALWTGHLDTDGNNHHAH